VRVIKWILVLLLFAVVGAGAWLYTGVQRPYRGYDSAEQFVEIPPGTGTAAMARRLADAGVVRSAEAFRLAVWLKGSGRRLQAGEYRFDRPMSPAEVVDKLVRGDVYVRAITFREGLTIREMAAVYENAGFGAAADFMAASKNAALIQPVDPEARDLEGYLFPDTYTLPRSASATQLVDLMVARFKKVLTPELTAQAAERGWSVRELVTLASLVEKETAKPTNANDRRRRLSNRLRIGMGMQADPTVIYALMLTAGTRATSRARDLQIDSPYNTYRVCRPAARADRQSRRRVARGRPQPRRCAVSLLRQPQRRLARFLHDARRAQRHRLRSRFTV
jgi:UPF0755 protein